jgi:hypothetical protein
VGSPERVANIGASPAAPLSLRRPYLHVDRLLALTSVPWGAASLIVIIPKAESAQRLGHVCFRAPREQDDAERVVSAAIFISAALLFAVQPMFTKMVLPRLGGAAAVWSVAPKAIAGEHRVWLLRRVQEADFTLRGLVSEFAERGAVKTKQRKTFETWFFPAGQDIEQIVVDRVRFLIEEKLWGLDDPLFPATKVAVVDSGQFQPVGLDRQPWGSTGPVRTIFREAFDLSPRA